MAKKVVDLEKELAELKARIAEQKMREREDGERELLKLVRRGDCLDETIAWAKSRAAAGRRAALTDVEADRGNAR